MKRFTLVTLITIIFVISANITYGSVKMQEIVFATFAQDKAELKQAIVLSKSLRSFGEDFKDSPFWLYLPAEAPELAVRARELAKGLAVEIKSSPTPESAGWFYYSGKTFAAGNAEAAASGDFKILAWLDADNIIVQEPKDFILSKGISFGWRPVMLKLIGSDYSKPPDEFWSRLYQIFSIDQQKVFPITTPVDNQQIRAYFNAGILIVRPERGLLRKWVMFYEKLYSDPFFQGECRKDVKKRIFLHQTALAGAALSMLDHKEMAGLGDHYNYPFFFFEKYPPEKRFKTLDEAITIRHDGVMYQDKEWRSKMIDDSKITEWIKNEFTTE